MLGVALAFVCAEAKIAAFRKKTAMKHDLVEEPQHQPRFNNQSGNKAIKIGIGWRIFILHMLVLAMKQLSRAGDDRNISVLFDLVVNFIAPVLEVSVIMPSLVCYENPEILKFFKEEYLA